MGFFSKIKKVVKKVGSFAKKALPYAAMALPFIPGVGQAASTVVGGISKAIGGFGSAQQADGFMGPPDPNRVEIPGSAPGFSMKDAMPIIQGGLNYMGQQQTNAANAQMAQKQMDFQASQTGSAYQRGTADMKAAGLNPMLAYSQGGAQSGGGATATMGNALGEGANSAFSAKRTMMEMENMATQNDVLSEQAELTAAQRRNTDAQTATELNRPENVRANTFGQKKGAEKTETEIRYNLLKNRLFNETYDAQASEITSAAELRKAQAQGEKYSLGEKGAYNRYWGDVGKGGVYAREIGTGLNSAANAAGKLLRFGR